MLLQILQHIDRIQQYLGQLVEIFATSIFLKILRRTIGIRWQTAIGFTDFLLSLIVIPMEIYFLYVETWWSNLFKYDYVTAIITAGLMTIAMCYASECLYLSVDENTPPDTARRYVLIYTVTNEVIQSIHYIFVFLFGYPLYWSNPVLISSLIHIGFIRELPKALCSRYFRVRENQSQRYRRRG